MIEALAFDFGHTLLDERERESQQVGDLMPGVAEALAAITLPMAVWANTRMGGERHIRSRLRRAAIEPYFQHVITSVEAGARKPEAKFFDYALSQCGWTRHSVLFVGNQLNTDVFGAVNYGIAVAWLSGQAYRSVDETMDPTMIRPTYTLATMHELPELLRQIRLGG